MTTEQEKLPHCIVLAGSGRSGTTWLGNIIAANPNMQTIFEPFDARRVPEAGQLPLRPYARPYEARPAWAAFTRRALTGQLHNRWVNRQGRRPWAWRQLVKTIRTTLLLGWIEAHFHPRIVFITRHPCAVVHSRLQLQWETHLDTFLQQPQLMADYLEPYRAYIEGATTATEKHAVMWAVENLIPLRQLQEHAWIFCTYEEFYADPTAEARRILAQLAIRHTCFTERALRRVTMVTRPDSAINQQRNPLTAWQHQLSSADIDTVLATVHAFGIRLYDDAAMPHPHTPLASPMAPRIAL